MMKLVAIFLSLFFVAGIAQADCTLAVTVNGAISAATSDYLERAEKRAIEKNCSSLFLRVNTPGGHLQSTRIIVEKILASPIPYLCLITPSGGHAGSAGAIILQACHVNGGVTATNIGAATPISGGGEQISDDLRKKLINDTVSWLEGVTKLRGRNLDFSKEIITEAKALSSETAVKEKALDILANNEADFLEKAKGREVVIQDKAATAVAVGDLVEFAPDTRAKVLNFIADPEFAYLLFMGSIGLLYVEITHPGLIAPGVVGGMGLVLSMIAFHKLDVEWGGLALILLGIVFLVLELFVPSFGILGAGGLISVFVGSLLLFDRETSGYSLSLPLIFSVVGTLAVIFLGVGYLALKTIRHKSSDADSDLLKSIGTVVVTDESGHEGQIQIMGEMWKFTSDDVLKVGDAVQVIARQGLTLNIKKNN